MSYLDDLFGLSGKTAVITGAATGIGRMMAEALVRAGARVLIASRKGADCARVAAELTAIGPGAAANSFHRYQVISKTGDVTHPSIDPGTQEAQLRRWPVHIDTMIAGIKP